ncbi:MAG: c-type cytochrome [Verrucomicrobiales bacterium]
MGLKKVSSERSRAKPSALVITHDPPPAIAAPATPPTDTAAPEDSDVASAQPNVPDPAPAPAVTPADPVVAKPVPPETGDAAGVVSVDAGLQLYNAMCVACHQSGGTGKVGFAPFIRNPDFLALATDGFLRDSITAGRPGTAMVPWAHLKPHEVDSLVAYLRSAEKPGVSKLSVADPHKKYQGDASQGAPLYATYCASCHGPNATGYAEGGAGPAIGNAGFLAAASDDFIFQTVKHGRSGTSMRGFVGASGLANLSEGQVGDIIAFLRNRDTSVPAVAERPGDAKAGHLHYNANCAACHQPDGSGLPGFAPSIRNADFLAIASDEFIKDTIKHGRPGTAMVQRPDLSDQVLDDIVTYLRALPGGPTRDIKVDPNLDLASKGNADHGLPLYAAYCASCHGEGGKGYIAGGPGTAIGLSGFLDSASDDYIFQTLKLGRAGTPMRPFMGARGLANLSEQEAFDVIAYLRTLNKPSS